MVITEAREVALARTQDFTAFPPSCHEPIAVRALQPTFTSFNTSSSDEAQPRVAFRAKGFSSQMRLLDYLKRTADVQLPTKADDVAPTNNELRTDDAIVKVLGWRTHGNHVVYTVLAAARVDGADGEQLESEARLVQRRFRDFVKLHEQLAPHASAAGLKLPALPSKLASLVNSNDTLGAQRKAALHEWLGAVVAQPPLFAAPELRRFLGLASIGEGTEDRGGAASRSDRPDAAGSVDLSELESLASLELMDDEVL